VEKEVGFELAAMRETHLALRNPDFTTARRVSQAINAFLGTTASTAIDPGTVRLTVPEDYRTRVVDLITDIEQLRIRPDEVARVIIDEQNGVIVMGQNVRISTVAIAQGNLTISVTEAPQVSQPAPFAQAGNTEVVDRTNIQIDEGQDRRLTVLDGGVSLQDLVNSLNTLGVGPRDMISILQAIKAAGALHAEIEVM
jgi:flagellar P-ring protein precursor FlgI